MTPLALAVQLAMAAAVGAGLIAAYRWLRQRSALCATLVAAGLLVRAALGLILFWTSYLNLPLLRQQHTGNGFWRLAIDATIYYYLALDAAERGFGSMVLGNPSPIFVKALALWLRALGPSPINGAYFNIAIYVVFCVIVVAVFRPTGKWREDLPCAVTLTALSFSPVLLIYGSQPLKDALFVCLIGMACVAAFLFLPWMTMRRGSAAVALGAAVVFVATQYAIGGIRPYYAVLTWSALALVLFLFLWYQGRRWFLPYAAISGVLLAGAWLSYSAGADIAYFNPYTKVIDKAWTLAGRTPPVRPPPKTAPEAATSIVSMVDQFRGGFVATPGKTNVVPHRPKPKAVAAAPVEESVPDLVTAPGRGAAGRADGARLPAVATGLALIFVPVSILRALSVVDLAGGRALMAMADLDTVFIDMTIAAAIALLVRRRSIVGDRLGYVCFAGVLGVTAALLMAYIVTNFGTLFRLRLMAVAPLWLLPLALGTRVRAAAEDPVADLAERTRASFGYEWTHFHRWQDSSDVSFRDCFETADLAALVDARVLDAGCGMGRHARQMSAHARHVIAVDFSRAIEQAAANMRDVANVDCVQADLLRLPFPDGTFDYVYCLGVLHHLANTETGVRALVDKVKPGGRLRVYLYWKRHGSVGVLLRLVNVVRPVTTRLPFWLLRWLCWMLSVALWLAVILPYRGLLALGVRGIDRWPLFVYARYPFRILYNDQFDRFSAPLEKRYDPDEVTALLESAGLRDVRVDACFGWIAEGVKPAGQG